MPSVQRSFRNIIIENLRYDIFATYLSRGPHQTETETENFGLKNLF